MAIGRRSQAQQNQPKGGRTHNESGRRDADAALGIRYSKALHYQGFYIQAMDVLREIIRDVGVVSDCWC